VVGGLCALADTTGADTSHREDEDEALPPDAPATRAPSSSLSRKTQPNMTMNQSIIINNNNKIAPQV
jgi:hypothetical protein